MNTFNHFYLRLILQPIFINFKKILNILNLIFKKIQSTVNQFSNQIFYIFINFEPDIELSNNFEPDFNFSPISNNFKRFEKRIRGSSSVVRDSSIHDLRPERSTAARSRSAIRIFFFFLKILPPPFDRSFKVNTKKLRIFLKNITGKFFYSLYPPSRKKLKYILRYSCEILSAYTWNF